MRAVKVSHREADGAKVRYFRLLARDKNSGGGKR